MRQVRRADQDQMFLLPQALEDWVGPEHPARFIREFVRQQNLAALGFAEPGAEGGPCYARELLLGVWLYGYFQKYRSTRRLEYQCRNELGLLWLCGGQAPDHNTLWRFFQEHRRALRRLFQQSVKIALQLQLVGLVLQAVDGTKIQALCSGYQSGKVEQHQLLLAHLDEVIAQHEAALAEAERQSAPVPAELPRTLRQKEALRAKVQAALTESARTEARQVHPQDLEARRMETDTGNAFGFNAQVVVDAQQQIILAAEVGAQANDRTQLVEMAAAAQANTGGQPVLTVADGGYASSAQLAAAEAAGLDVLTKLPSRWRQAGPEDPFHASHFQYEPEGDVVRCPAGRALPYRRTRHKDHRGEAVREYRSKKVCQGCPWRAQCTSVTTGRSIDLSAHHQALQRQRVKFDQPEAQAALRQRGRIVEPVFAQLKGNHGFRRWTMRGLQNVRAQWDLLCTTWNLQVLWRHWRQGLRLPQTLVA